MRTDGARPSPLRYAVILAGLGLVGVGLWQLAARRPPPVDVESEAAEVRTRVEHALRAAAAGLEPAARTAAGLPELRSAWKMGADRTTFQDLIDNEDWWSPYRSGFTLSAIVTDGGVVATRGAHVSDASASALVTEARARGVASGVVDSAEGRAFISAAARLAPGKAGNDQATGALPVVLLGAPLDQAVLQRAAGETGDVVGLSNGAALIAVSGPSAARALAEPLIGHERDGPRSLADGRIAAVWQLGQRAWLIAVSPPSAAAPRDLGGLWLALAGAAMAVAAALLRRRPAQETPEAGAPVPGPEPSESSWPAQRSSSVPTSSGRAAAARPVSETRALPTALANEDNRDSGGDRASPSSVALAAQEPAASGGPIRMGRYRLIERIGEGGMAEIFFAAAYGAENFVRHFVVKRMHPHLSGNREVVNQFIDEARLQAGLVHSNIVPVFDFGKAGQEYYLALEYIHGRDLGRIVQRHVELRGVPLPDAIAFYIVHEVLDALAFAHAQTGPDGRPMEIVHRDVAPGNILISYRGEVKLTDFGIAKAERRVSRTEVGMVKGNASFMSPEQARGEIVDARSDVFSAGLVLFYALTGRFFYHGETTLNRLMRAAVGPATEQFQHIEQLSQMAGNILRRALAIDSSQRFATADAFKRDLAPYVGAGTRRELADLMDALFPTSQRRDLRAQPEQPTTR
ncbi:MAG TPA: protein kinase [Polyangia bacterium]|nr:protein kinase [Polyangia bacterium]